MSEELIGQLSQDLLWGATRGALATGIAEALAKPTPELLHDAASRLVTDGYLDAAEPVFRALLERLNFGARAAIGLARIAAQRGDLEATCSAWRDCLRRFSDDAQPYWYLELARAERQLGRSADAETSLRKCAERFPKFTPAAPALADLLANTNRPAEAVDLWRTAIQSGSEQIKPWWILGYARALRAAGLSEQPDTVLEEALNRSRDEPTVLAFLAKRAAGREDWAAALDLWARCVDRHSAEPDWLNGRAIALFRLWRAEEAMEMWRDLIARYPDFVPGYTEMALAAADLGQWHTADDCWSLMTKRFPERLEPEWLAGRARCSHSLRLNQSADAAVAELEKRFPTLSLGRQVAIKLANRRDVGLITFEALVDAAVGRFPADRVLLAEQVRVLLARERLADAEAIVKRLEADAEDHDSLISRWRLLIERDGEGAIAESVRQALSDHSRGLPQILGIGGFLLNLSTSWSLEQALLAFNDADRRFPGRVALVSARARTLVVLQRDREALELVESIPPAYQSQDVMELRAWARARRGEIEAARQIWLDLLARYYVPAVHSAESRLELVVAGWDEGPFEGVTAFVPVRDELAQLPEFLRHHRRLGVRRFIVIDNLSTDGSDAYLRVQPDVMLYRTADNFQTASSGMRWINALIERHGAGGWCLFADADEAFVYPGWESIPISHLTEYLDREGAEGVAAFMLDVYPERLPVSADRRLTHADCRHYDADYDWIGHVRPPYRRPLGGVRARLFRVREYLQKVPLIKSGRGVYLSNHDTSPLRFASVSGLLLHYKMLALHAKHAQAPAGKGGNPFMTDVNLEIMSRYERYAAQLATVSRDDLRVSGVSQTLTDSLTLADRGLMQAPLKFRQWLKRTAAAGKPARAGSKARSG